MSDETSRPRRAWDDDLQEPLVPEEFADEPDARPRRGVSASEESHLTAGLGDDPVPPPPNAFARPGSDEAAVPFDWEPFDAEPGPEPMIPAPVFPRSAGEFATSPGPAPRRSALSGNTPVEVEGARSDEPQGSWVAAHRGTLAQWGLIALIGALLVGLIAFFVSRNLGAATPEESPTQVQSTSPSPTPLPEPAQESDLLNPADLEGIAPAADWSVINTSTAAGEHDMRPMCLSTMQQSHNPTHSFQRTLGTTGDDKLAALHRIDVFASEAAAKAVLDIRIAALSNCTETPAYMARASNVTGLADQTFQVTILQEDDPAKYHTMLLTRDGAAVQLLDVARDDEPADAGALATSLVRTQTRLVEVQGSTAPSSPEATPAVVPPAEPRGWLTPVDLRRFHPGVGRWTMTSPQPVDTRGMGCEDMELATEPGPTERAKVAYALTQDPQIPERFGIDQIMFSFDTPEAAAAFVTKLGANMHSCKDRVNTAEVEELPGVSPLDAEGNRLSARIFEASQAISDSERVHYQLIVGVAHTRVAYTLITVTPEVKFSPERLNELATRLALRVGQLHS